MDHYRGLSDDRTHRSIAKRFNQCLWTNHKQLELDSVDGSVFIELALVLPMIMMVIWGSVAVFQVMEVNLALNDAAVVGVQAEMDGASSGAVEKDIDTALQQAGINPRVVSIQLQSGSSLTDVHLSTSLQLPVVGAVTISATQQSYATP